MTLRQVGKHILLPNDEMPQVASVTDAATLAAQQPFYANTQDGDVVLLYAKSQRAIIYSPARDLIVNVGPVVPNGT